MVSRLLRKTREMQLSLLSGLLPLFWQSLRHSEGKRGGTKRLQRHHCVDNEGGREPVCAQVDGVGPTISSSTPPF